MKNAKILLVGSFGAHTENFYDLIKNEVGEVMLFSDKKSQRIKTKVFNFSLKNIISLPTKTRQLRKEIIAYNPSIIHIHQANSYAFYTLLAVRRLNIPTITTLWGSDVLLMPKRNFLLRKMFQFIIERSNYLTADARVLIDEAKKYTQQVFQFKIANYGVDFLPVEIVKDEVIYSNRLHQPLYRIDKIINDFISFNKRQRKWKLIVGAVGAETDHLKQMAESAAEANIEFCGWLEKKDNIENYAKSKVYVSIPESDGTAISLLEAMYYECFPIVSDLPANREWIVDGKNGIILQKGEGVFDRLNEVDFAKAVEFNKNLVMKKGSKSANRAIFIEFYQSLILNKNG